MHNKKLKSYVWVLVGQAAVYRLLIKKKVTLDAKHEKPIFPFLFVLLDSINIMHLLLIFEIK